VALNLRRGVTSERIKEKNIEISTKIEELTNLNDLWVCITGTIPGMSRFEAQSNLIMKYPKIKFSETITPSVYVTVSDPSARDVGGVWRQFVTNHIEQFINNYYTSKTKFNTITTDKEEKT
jgi:hypothetical protein